MLSTFLAHLLTSCLVLLTVYVWCRHHYPEPQIHDFVVFPEDYFLLSRREAAEQTSDEMTAVLRDYLRNIKKKGESAKREAIPNIIHEE